MRQDLRLICEQEEEREIKKRLNNENHEIFTPIQRFYNRYGYDWKERYNQQRGYKNGDGTV